MGVKSKPLVYVAGPISSNPWRCLGEALICWKPMREAGAIPFFPQFGIVHAMIEETDYQEHFDYGIDMMLKCDLVVRMPGKSPGADAEEGEAKAHGIPVIHLTYDDLKWMSDGWSEFLQFMVDWNAE